jgi:hypothetical protein
VNFSHIPKFEILGCDKLHGGLAFQNEYCQSVKFYSKLTGQKWTLTNNYAPCTSEGKVSFINWFRNIAILDEHMWLVLGDFNLIRRTENRNMPGGDVNMMHAFNEAISTLGVIEIPLSGQSFTWSNRQQNPLLERLEWFFMSQSWSLEFPGTRAMTLSRDVSDHVPCIVCIKTEAPKLRIFRFKIFWMEHSSFQSIFQQAWAIPNHKTDPAMRMTAKLKTAKKFLKDWQNNIPKLATSMENIKLMIQFLDMIEEARDLEIREWNFRDILLGHLGIMLEWQRMCWRQRGRIKWVTQGDAGTKFFHANTTIRHRQNLITSLQQEDGISKHEEKADLLWESYKQRLGTSEFSRIYFDLHELLTPLDELDFLQEPFTLEDIISIIKELPLDKSPGSDGFNGDFLKKCWLTVQHDFLDLCQGFFAGSICMRSINTSHIVLVPKIDNPTRVGGYRPISLLNSSIKLLTKVLANRLQQVITQLVHRNQYGFFRNRSIEDWLAWAFEYLYLCKKIQERYDNSQT